ncbi:Protein of unknown function DUF820 [Synechocystis sp. LKSZ1]
MTLALSPLTLKDFLQLPNIEESPAWELINQVPSQKPMPTLYHSRLQKRLVAKIDNASTIYEALPEFRCVLSTNSIVPDIAITHTARLPTTNQPLEGAPDWLIEILFPDQRSTKIITKIQTCLEEGTQLAWLIDPLEEIILVFQPHQPLLICRGDSILPVPSDLPLTLSAQEIFSWLQS